MEMDLDAILNVAKPWAFTVRVGGAAYATRRPAVAELAAFGAVGEHPERLVPLLVSLFDGPAPDVAGWTVDHLVAFVTGYVAYFNAANEAGADGGNAGAAVAAAATAAVATAMATGGPAAGGD